MYWPELDQLDDDQVTAAYEIIAQTIAEKCPELNPERGVVGSLLTELHAILQGCSVQAWERLRNSLNARVVAERPADALPDAVDALAANYRIRRKISTKACGDITVVLTRKDGVNFGPNSKFRAKGQFFYVTRPITVRPPGAEQRSVHDVPCVETSDGKFSVQIPVRAAEATDAAMLRRFDTLQPTVKPSGFVSAYATSDFVGGRSKQTNAELVRQLLNGFAQPGFSNKASIKALVCQSGVDVVDIAVVGARDTEMVRDGGNGGMIDIYLQSQHRPALRSFVKTAQLVEHAENGAVWEVLIDRDDAPGFYDVVDIREIGDVLAAASCKIVDDARGCDTAGFAYVPSMPSPDDARLSRYQTARIRFFQPGNTYGLVVGEATRDFEVTVAVMPGVACVQDYLNAAETRQPGLDVLVKAVKPCRVNVEIVTNGTQTIDLERATAAAHDYIDSLPIGAQPNAYMLAARLPDAGAIQDIRIEGLATFDAASTAFLNDDGIKITRS